MGQYIKVVREGCRRTGRVPRQACGSGWHLPHTRARRPASPCTSRLRTCKSRSSDAAPVMWAVGGCQERLKKSMIHMLTPPPRRGYACRCCRNVCRRVGGANRRDPCAAQLRPYEGNEVKRSCKWCVLAQVQVHRVAGQRAAARAIATYRAASPKIAPVYPSITSLAQGYSTRQNRPTARRPGAALTASNP